MLPFNEAGLDNAGGTDAFLFLAGDVRANENIALTAMHTLWVREHNNIAAQIAAQDRTLNDEEIYQAAKAIVTAELQAITFNEFLPALLGESTTIVVVVELISACNRTFRRNATMHWLVAPMNCDDPSQWRRNCQHWLL